MEQLSQPSLNVLIEQKSREVTETIEHLCKEKFINMIGLRFRLNLLIAFLLLSLMQLPMSLNAAQSSLIIVPAGKVQWSALNPARGANSPQAGQLWGDRKTPGATGFLVKFKEFIRFLH